jgi:hypothetical protein
MENAHETLENVHGTLMKYSCKRSGTMDGCQGRIVENVHGNFIVNFKILVILLVNFITVTFFAIKE